jgi:HD superfamily phosphohydrolase
MLHVHNDQLVVESKGIHSIEKFLIARWLMYWQVYLHKTVVSAEQLLIKIFDRVGFLISQKASLYLNPELNYFFNDKPENTTITAMLDHFSVIDDGDIYSMAKIWISSADKVLADLANRLLSRNLFKIEIQDQPFESGRIETLKEKACKTMGLKNDELDYFVFTNHISKNAYSALDDKIQILFKNNIIKDVAEASDMLNTSVLSKMVRKYFLCYPKELR